MKFILLLLICYASLIQAQVYKKYLHLSYAEIDSFTFVNYQNGAYEKAIPYLEAGKAKAKIEFGTQDSIYAEYLGNLGFFCHHTGQYEKTELLYIEAKNIKEKIFGKEHHGYAAALNNLAGLYERLGRYQLAESLFLQAQKIWTRTSGKEHPEYSTSLNNLASLYKNMGHYQMAEPLFLEAIEIDARLYGEQHPYYATSLNNSALLYLAMERYEMAEPLLVKAKKIRLDFFGKEHPAYGTSLANLAGFYENVGNYPMAESLLLEALLIAAKTLGKEHRSYTNSLNNLANLYIKMNNYKKAEPLFIECLEIGAKTLGEKHPAYTNYETNLASFYEQLGRYEKAWTLIQQAIRSSTGLTLSNVISNPWADSIAHSKLASYEHFENLMEALDISYEILVKDKLDLNKEKQVIIADLAIILLRKCRKSFSDSEEKLRLLSNSNDWMLRSMNDIDKEKQAEKAFEIAEQSKSVLLMEASKTQLAYRMGNLPDSLVKMEEKIIEDHDKLQAKLLEKRPSTERDSLRKVLNKVNQTIKFFKNKIEKEFPQYAKLKYQNIDTKVANIQGLLNDKTALLEYVIGDSVVYIFYIDKKTFRMVEQKLDTEEMSKKIKSLHMILSNYKLLIKQPAKSYKQYIDPAHWFYQNLIAPVLKKTNDIEDLIIVTDGELGHLPFEVFLVEAASQGQTDYGSLHYLLKDYNISYNYSATLWKENKEASKKENNGKVLGMAANYNVKLDSSGLLLRSPIYQLLRKKLKPLPEVRAEIEGLAEEVNFNGFFAFDTLASEKTFKEKAENYAIIHLAMHGILDNKTPILSSLAFTEDSDSIENNFLHAYEISKLKLHADLVILSACETGYGKFEKGNGIASLARAFMYAGASSLVVSLWQVNDLATSEIMKYFYQNLTNGMDKSEALGEAKLSYMEDTKGIAAHPAFWSPFIQIGNTNPITLNKKRSFWFWGLGLGLVLAAGFLMSRRRNRRLT